MTLTGTQSIQIQVLHDYIIIQYQRIEPIGVIRLLDNIKRAFSVRSATAQLAEQFRIRILNHWGRGNLTRLQLFLYAFPLLYESCVDLVRARRRLTHILLDPKMDHTFVQRRHQA